MAQLRDVNTTDIGDSIRLGCQAMSRAFNADDADIPYGGAQVRPEAFLGGSMEGHMPGRLLNAMLVAEDAMGLDLDEEVIDKHARAGLFLLQPGTAALAAHRPAPQWRGRSH